MLLPRGVSGSTKYLLIALLIFSPLAYAGSVYLFYDLERTTGARFEVTRNEAARTARSFAEELGLDTSTWIAPVAAQVDQEVQTYYNLKSLSPVHPLRRGFPATTLEVLLSSTGAERLMEVRLSSRGEVLGFRRQVEGGRVTVGAVTVDPAPRSSEEESRDLPAEQWSDIAESAFHQHFGDSRIFRFEGPEVSRERQGSVLTQTYTWSGTTDQYPEVIAAVRVSVRNGILYAVERDLNFEEEYREAYLEYSSIPRLVLGILQAIAVVFITIYALVLYARRWQQDEVSHARNLSLGVILGLSFAAIAILGSGDRVVVETGWWLWSPILLIVLFGLIFSYLILGLVVAVYWGAAEGEVRERFPGKLTSFDALMTGRIFSANVARSLIAGVALGGWVLLFISLGELPWRSSPYFGATAEAITLFYTRLPLLFVALNSLMGPLTVAVAGLLLPVTLSYRFFESKPLRWLFLTLLAILGCSWIGLQVTLFGQGIVIAFVSALFLLLGFFVWDLLTAMFALSAHTFTSTLLIFITKTPMETTSLVAAVVLAFSVVAVAGYFSFKGRYYQDEEVRPLYAEHLAERMSMQAEVAAAREAQVRLAPQSLPETPGISIAASCDPARIVGGDFYDFYPISPTRLGLLFAEGGHGGLSAALMIAYAKGRLLPLVEDLVEPTQAIEELRGQLDSLREENSNLGLVFAIIDTEQQTLSWSRVGSYPRLILLDLPGGAPPTPEADGDQGELPLSAGQVLFFYSDGLSEVLEVTTPVRPSDWLRDFLRRESNVSVGELYESLRSTLQSKAKKARKRGIEDDMAAILIRIERSPARWEVA